MIEFGTLGQKQECLCCGKTIRSGSRAIQLSDGNWIHTKCRWKFATDIRTILDPEGKELAPEYKQHTKKLRVLDLCSGKGGWSKAFAERGHHVVTIDIDPKFEPDICADIMELSVDDIGRNWDIVLASPPCQGFSVASCGTHWAKNTYSPKTEFAENSLLLVHHIHDMIQEINPRYWAMENPRGMLRKVWKYPELTTYFASWSGGDLQQRRPQKPTDLWGVFPIDMLWPEPRRWELAPRGTQRGTQGIKDPAERAVIPWGLSFTFCINCENEESNLNYKTQQGVGGKLTFGPLEVIMRLMNPENGVKLLL